MSVTFLVNHEKEIWGRILTTLWSNSLGALLSRVTSFFHLSRSVFVDRFEEVLHIVYGQKDYWKVLCLIFFWCFHYFRSVMIDRFEKVLHIHYGQVEYWKVICLQTVKLRSTDLGSLAHYSQTVTRIRLVYKLQGAIWTKFPGANRFRTPKCCRFQEQKLSNR